MRVRTVELHTCTIRVSFMLLLLLMLLVGAGICSGSECAASRQQEQIGACFGKRNSKRLCGMHIDDAVGRRRIMKIATSAGVILLYTTVYKHSHLNTDNCRVLCMRTDTRYTTYTRYYAGHAASSGRPGQAADENGALGVII